MNNILTFADAGLLLIDMNRAHLDPALDYLPVAPEDSRRVIDNARRVLDGFRRHGLPTLYVRTAYRYNPETNQVLDNKNPFWLYQRQHAIPGAGKKRTFRAVEGADVTEIVPELAPRAQDPVVTKKRYSGFQGTNLEMTLRNMGIQTLYMMGCNTNNCVLCTCFEAFNRDFKVVLLEDCCASMNGPDFHEWAVRQVEAALGWVSTSDQILAALERRAIRVEEAV